MSHPERNFSVFDTPFWNKYPFALPCFISAAFAVVAVAFGYLSINEVIISSLPFQQYNAYLNSPQTLAPKRSKVALSAIPTSTSVYSGTQDDESVEQQGWRRYFSRSLYTPHLISVLVSSMFMCLSSEVLFALFVFFLFFLTTIMLIIN